LPIHLFIPELKRLAASALLLGPLAARAGESGLPDGLYAEITTTRGVITCELEAARAPLTVTSFVGLAEGSLGPAPRKPFFDGLKFHRVVPGFVIQGGDPLGTGEGGPGYAFADEFSPALSHDSAGVLSMANDGPDTNGSQFFITLAPVDRLDFLHSVFGRTVRGLDVLPKVVQGDAMTVRILRIGAAARAFTANDRAFALLAARTPKFSGVAQPGPTAHFDDPDKVLPQDVPRAQNFNFKLGNFERATGFRIYARVFAKFVPATPGETPAELAVRLARSLGLEDSGVLAVYFADTDSWDLSVGRSMEAFFIKPGDSAESGTLTRQINIFLTESDKRRATYAIQTKISLPNFLQIPGQKAKIAVDAVLDELLVKVSSQK